MAYKGICLIFSGTWSPLVCYCPWKCLDCSRHCSWSGFGHGPRNLDSKGGSAFRHRPNLIDRRRTRAPPKVPRRIVRPRPKLIDTMRTRVPPGVSRRNFRSRPKLIGTMRTRVPPRVHRRIVRPRPKLIDTRRTRVPPRVPRRIFLSRRGVGKPRTRYRPSEIVHSSEGSIERTPQPLELIWTFAMFSGWAFVLYLSRFQMYRIYWHTSFL